MVFDTDKNGTLSKNEFMVFADMAQIAPLNPSSTFWVNILHKKTWKLSGSRDSFEDDSILQRKADCLEELHQLAYWR